MTVMVELEQRVEDAQKKLSEALAGLAEFSELRKGLESANGSITKAADAVTDLAAVGERTTQALSHAAKELAKAAELMQQTVFGEIQQEIRLLNRAIKQVDDQLRYSTELLVSEIKEASHGVEGQVIEFVSSKLSELREDSRKNSFFTWILIGIAIFTSAYAIFVT